MGMGTGYGATVWINGAKIAIARVNVPARLPEPERLPEGCDVPHPDKLAAETERLRQRLFDIRLRRAFASC